MPWRGELEAVVVSQRRRKGLRLKRTAHPGHTGAVWFLCAARKLRRLPAQLEDRTAKSIDSPRIARFLHGTGGPIDTY